MLTTVNGAQYVYDALQQRVEKTGDSNPTEVVYFNGHPIALLNPSTGAWTDLIWAGSNLLAEVAGTQTATPEYRLLDHEGSLVMITDGSGNVTGTNLLMPYGETLASNTTSDPYAFTGLYQDTEYGGDDAWFRNYSTEQDRWLRPDPYNGSYDLMNPQSFNRYMYVNGNPLGYVDPSGLAGGVLNYLGTACGSHGFKLASSFVCGPIGLATNIACDFTSNQEACGFPGLTSFIPGPKWIGQSISASISAVDMIAEIVCATSGGSACELALAIFVYNLVHACPVKSRTESC